MAQRKPAERCAVCNSTLEETGGKRLIATPTNVISLCTIQTTLGSVRHSARTIRLTDNYRDVIVVISGEALWTDEVAERIRVVSQEGLRPWFCQRCVDHQICKLCSTPLSRVPVADYLEDDGRTLHASFLTGFAQSCSNSACRSVSSTIQGE